MVPLKALSGTPEGPARQTQQVGRAHALASLRHSAVEGSEAVVPLKALSGTPEGPARQTQQVGRARALASLQHSAVLEAVRQWYL